MSKESKEAKSTRPSQVQGSPSSEQTLVLGIGIGSVVAQTHCLGSFGAGSLKNVSVLHVILPSEL